MPDPVAVARAAAEAVTAVRDGSAGARLVVAFRCQATVQEDGGWESGTTGDGVGFRFRQNGPRVYEVDVLGDPGADVLTALLGAPEPDGMWATDDVTVASVGGTVQVRCRVPEAADERDRRARRRFRRR